ncbi:translation initiation factor IF-2-like [Manacus candei]|uniref:translation initiation factor IF-2-like n=1 Tax=Manacus candei TaxID=415023 RepID=UPI00222783D9|nr:translation initiation factor IF-2-like [Manacus candei]
MAKAPRPGRLPDLWLYPAPLGHSEPRAGGPRGGRREGIPRRHGASGDGTPGGGGGRRVGDTALSPRPEARSGGRGRARGPSAAPSRPSRVRGIPGEPERHPLPVPHPALTVWPRRPRFVPVRSRRRPRRCLSRRSSAETPVPSPPRRAGAADAKRGPAPPRRGAAGRDGGRVRRVPGGGTAPRGRERARGWPVLPTSPGAVGGGWGGGEHGRLPGTGREALPTRLCAGGSVAAHLGLPPTAWSHLYQELLQNHRIDEVGKEITGSNLSLNTTMSTRPWRPPAQPRAAPHPSGRRGSCTGVSPRRPPAATWRLHRGQDNLQPWLPADLGKVVKLYNKEVSRECVFE